MLTVAGRTAAVSISDGGALAPRPSVDLRPWRVPTLVLGAALACIAALALATLPSATAHRAHPLAPRHGLASLPITLAPAVSASIGASERSFWPVRHGASLLTQGGGIHSTFAASGAALRVPQGTLDLSLTAVGRGQSLHPVAAVAPTRTANRVLYRHGSIDEFYRNGPYGLEQDFTLGQRPRAGTGSSLVLTLRVGGSLLPTQEGWQVLFRDHAGLTALRYGHLSVLDASGRWLAGHMQVRNRTLQLRINDRGARYPLRIDPFFQQGETPLTLGEEIGRAAFGNTVSLSSDGNTALVGGPGDNRGVGAVWVFTRSGSIWVQRGEKLTAGGEPGTREFGRSVALSADGNTALIGGYGNNKEIGAAWVFTRSGSTWTEQAMLTGGGEIGEGRFGQGVALSSDGNTALIGGSGDNERIGAAWVFTRSGSAWTQQGEKLTGSGEAGTGNFGYSVALSADGDTALIGGLWDNGVFGAAWIFTRSGSTWTQQGSKLTGSGESGGGDFLFGTSVALSSDGDTALIGGSEDNYSVGAAWVFTRSGSTWTEQAMLTGGGEIGEGRFGQGVALSSDGNTALIGGSGDNERIGAAWVFTRSGSTWSQQGKKLTGSGESGEPLFGTSVALSSDGNTALIGAPGESSKVGAAWVFTRSGSRRTSPVETWTRQGEKLTGGGEVGKGDFGQSVALSSDGNSALIGAPADNNKVGAAWVFTRSGSTWTQQGEKLTGSGEVGTGKKEFEEDLEGGRFGQGVALSSDGNTALIGGPGDNDNVGAAWVFTRSGSTWTQQGDKLTGGGETGSARTGGRFGESVALSSDGTTAFIGAPGNDYCAGAGWVFTRSGSTWSQQAELHKTEFDEHCVSDPDSTTYYGKSVALSSDGNTALLGYGHVSQPGGKGALVYTRSGSTWSQQAELGTHIGYGAALSSDGDTALLGMNNGSLYGGAEAFTRTGSVWTEEGPRLEVEGVAFGASAALSSDGNTALIGGPGYNSGVGAVWVFTRDPLLPTVITNSTSSVSQTSATLNATVNPNGVEVRSCYFEYGTTASYGSSVPCSSLPGAGETPVAVSEAVGSLGANTGYHFRIVATNSGGTNHGSDKTLKTLPNPPAVVTGAASSIMQASATLNATVNPNGGTVSDCHFDYGITTSYRSSVPCTTPPGSGTSAMAVSAPVGLSAGTTYYFRIVATNSGGTGYGADQALTTLLPGQGGVLGSQEHKAPLVPTVANPSQSNSTWSEGNKLAAFSRKKKPPVGTSFSFILNEQARVSFAFTQQLGGRKVKGKCVAQTTKNRHKPSCKRTVTRGTLSFTGHRGTNKVSFQGRIAASKRLPVGRYKLVIIATNAAGERSSPKSLSFTIVK